MGYMQLVQNNMTLKSSGAEPYVKIRVIADIF